MKLQSKSRNLSRTQNDNEYSIKYHKTTVLSYDKHTCVITLKTDGWETMNTARAMNIGFEEVGIDAHVEYKKNKKEQGLFLIIRGERHKVYNRMTISL